MSYATVADALDEGVPTAIPDSTIQQELDTWSQFIDRACRQWFEPRSYTFDCDGNDSNRLFFPVPIISVTALYVNGDFTNVLDPARYRVYNSRNMAQDDRRNPKIALTPNGMTIFSGPPIGAWGAPGPCFLRGIRNQRVVGTFGYTEIGRAHV